MKWKKWSESASNESKWQNHQEKRLAKSFYCKTILQIVYSEHIMNE